MILTIIFFLIIMILAIMMMKTNRRSSPTSPGEVMLDSHSSKMRSYPCTRMAMMVTLTMIVDYLLIFEAHLRMVIRMMMMIVS